MLDPVENSLFDIPDYENTEDESFPPLPPPLSPGQEDGDPFANGEEGEGDLSKLAEAPVAKRRSVKRPQPKLDSQRLVSERGLPALRTLFDSVRFKGKGHEAEDLRVLMQKMENWAHRLYPKLQFEDFIDKLEALGSKKEVQTCLKRIRLDMPLTHEDFIGNDGQEEALSREDHVPVDPDPFGDGGFADDPMVHSTPAPPPSWAPASLTEEQQQRIQLNKQLALERRLARLKGHTESTQSQPSGAEEPSDPSSQLLSQSPSDQRQGVQNHSQSQRSPAPRDPPPSDPQGQGGPFPELTNGRDDDSD
ncbi:TIMELESS-interacting protein [Conger conger]|uniref:TIMELESS-interacting protein n=1 Tax=Conger conger TaxID=82655 RepID=UPI002A599C40|nr:TIMELESS-interacting protein [Conger conger]XP_061077859.1 TIMELESS-interacting protein [Conger conger]